MRRHQTDPMLKCHCRDYQQATGSAYAALMVVQEEAFRSFTSGLGPPEKFRNF
ncbi:GFA family protein [Microvirga sp. BT688]|uniref:GFA family protein n=1 Tax=Microvirga sp. TaxID=1873136 RepID=UPI0016887C5A|nr:GFA family protein [Microvirga sp.]